MSPHNEQHFCEQYPLIFRARRGRQPGDAPYWGLAVQDGWFDLIDMLCAHLYATYRQAAKSYERAREGEGKAPYPGAEVVTAVDVERKRLAMKAAETTVPRAVQVKEKFGTLRFYVDGGSPEMQAVIAFAEDMSSRMCEQCGAPAHTRAGGWVRTLCDEHEAQYQSRKTALA